MASYAYTAINESGQEISGVIEASDEAAANKTLEGQNLMPLKIGKSRGGAAPTESASAARPLATHRGGKKRKPKKIVLRDVTDFTRQLVTLLKAGVPILTSLETLAGQADNPNFEAVLNQVAEDIATGSDFSAALAKHPKVFNGLYVNGVKAGEAGGVLDDVLTRLVSVLSRDEETRKKVKGAMRYPTIVMSGMAIAFLVMVTFVVPKFSDIFTKVGLKLPLPTVILMFLADIVMGYWWALIIGTGVAIFGTRWYINTPKGSLVWDNISLKIPIVGDLLLKQAMARFTRMFETLSRSGLPILQIFDIVSRTMGNQILGNALLKSAESIEGGKGISVSLEETGYFPPLVIKMISVGEDSGAIDEMLATISDFYEAEVEESVEGLTGMIEPILTLGMGGMVLLLMLAIFLPMWDMMEMAKQQ
ncbi:type II secretion system F family protein [Calditrichota bacterium]